LHGPLVAPQGTSVAENEEFAGTVVDVVVDGVVVVEEIVVVVVDATVVVEVVLVDPGTGRLTCEGRPAAAGAPPIPMTVGMVAVARTTTHPRARIRTLQ
jgi:hypothetical protein